jgi:hypothetical protein
VTQRKAKIAKKYGQKLAEWNKLVKWDSDDFRVVYIHPITGKPTGMYRKRHTKREGNGKYTQPAGTIPEAYFPPVGISWKLVLDDTERTIFVTEGELKAAKACVEGFSCLGLGGIFNFQSAKRGMEWIPTLDHVKWAGRKVIVVADSDAKDKPQVRRGANRLCARLAERHAIPHLIVLPSEDERKIGLDDYLILNGREKFAELVASTKAWKAEQMLHELNEEAIHVKNPNCIALLPTPTQPELLLVDKDDFHDHYADWKLMPIDKGQPYSASKAWAAWADRERAYDVTLAPGRPTVFEDTLNGRLVRRVNTWTGWGGEPVKGDVGPLLRLCDHLFSANPKQAARFWMWCAYRFQHPEAQINTAYLMFGSEGTGKSLLGETIGLAHGDGFGLLTQANLSSDFTGWLKGKTFLVGNEVTTKDSRRNEVEKLKNIVTDPYLEVNEKHKPHFRQPNRLQLYLTSNDPNALLLSDSDRRFCVIEAPDETPKKFIDAVLEWRKKQVNLNALLHHLMHEVDCKGFDPGERAPMTAAKTAMVENSRTVIERFVFHLRDEPDTIEGIDPGDVRTLHTTRELLGLAERVARGPLPHYWNDTSLGNALRKAKLEQRTVKVEGRSQKLWALRDRQRLAAVASKVWASVRTREAVNCQKGKKFAIRG